MKRIATAACLLVFLLALPAISQDASKTKESEQKEEELKEQQDKQERVTREAKARPGTESDAKEALADRLRRAARLPRTAEDARDAGVPEEEVKEVLRRGKGSRVPAGEMQEVLEQENRSAREHGPIDNFGGFVQQKLDQGLRGRELADAIHREHAARGKGKYRDKPGKPGKGKDKAGKKSRDAAGHDEDRDHDRTREGRGHDSDDDDDRDHDGKDDRDRRHDEDDDGSRAKRTRDLEDRSDGARDDARKQRDAAKEKLDEAGGKLKGRKPGSKPSIKKKEEK